jgi:hypothetical protein
MGSVRFDLAGLFAAIDAKRADRGLSWAALSREVGIAASTIKRFADADDAEADGVLALIRWVGEAPEEFIDGVTSAGEPLTAGDQGFVRVDIELVAEASGEPGGAKGRTRTTIQRLAAAAHGSQQSVASLTRLSEV